MFSLTWLWRSRRRCTDGKNKRTGKKKRKKRVYLNVL